MPVHLKHLQLSWADRDKVSCRECTGLGALNAMHETASGQHNTPVACSVLCPPSAALINLMSWCFMRVAQTPSQA